MDKEIRADNPELPVCQHSKPQPLTPEGWREHLQVFEANKEIYCPQTQTRALLQLGWITGSLLTVLASQRIMQRKLYGIDFLFYVFFKAA